MSRPSTSLSSSCREVVDARHKAGHGERGKTMATDSKKPKAEAAPKKDAAAKVESPAAKAAPKDTSKPDTPKDTSKPDTPKDASKPESGETATAAPSNYSRGEGQKPVTAAYKENWNAIFAKKGTKKKKR
jgi:hypothetical protein